MQEKLNKSALKCVLSIIEDIMQRYCVCGKMIAGRRKLCPECASIYGSWGEYPEWLKFMLADMEREYRMEEREARHSEFSLDDDTPKPRRTSKLEQLDQDGLLILRG